MVYGNQMVTWPMTSRDPKAQTRDPNTLRAQYLENSHAIITTLWVKKKLGHFFTAYNFRNIKQIFTKFGTNQSLFIMNIVTEFI